MSHEVFVSYASSDRVVAYRMVDYLESCGVRCWVAPRDVPGGRNYAEAILNALHEARVFLLLFSEGSNSSEHVQREVERALHLSKPMVPVRIRDVFPSGAMDYYLATLHWIDAFSPESETGGAGAVDDGAGMEFGFEDVLRATGSLLGVDEAVASAIADRRRQSADLAERRRREAEERELRLRLETEARGKAEAEAAAAAAARATAEVKAEARLRREEQQRLREREDKEEQRQQRDRERQRELERERREREERERERKREQKEKQKIAAAEGRGAGQGMSSARSMAWLLLLLALVATGFWAKQRFQPPVRAVGDSGPVTETGTDGPPAHSDAGTTPVPALADASAANDNPAPPDPAPAPPPSVARVRAAFDWAGERRFTAASDLVKVVLENNSKNKNSKGATSRVEASGDRLAIPLPGSANGGKPSEKSTELEATFELAIPGFSMISRRMVLVEGETDIDFGPLVRRQAGLRIQNDYADQPRADEAHREWLKTVRVVWEGVLPEHLKTVGGSAVSSRLAALLHELQSAGEGAGGEWPLSTDAPREETLDTGVYGVFLTTHCRPPFDQVRIGTVKVEPNRADPAAMAGVTVPLLPIGVFGGTSEWTATSTEGSEDADGSVAWNFYNLPPALDVSEDGPRMVQSYVDIVSDGTIKKTIYLPAVIDRVSYEPESRSWTVRADPTDIVKLLVDDDLTDRYYEALDFVLKYHPDKRGLLFDVETIDQPLNASTGTPRQFTLQNAYPVFAEEVDILTATYPGFGVLDLTAVYDHIAGFDKKNAETYRRTLTLPTATSVPLAIELGMNVDAGFTGGDSVRLAQVAPDGPAASAGLQKGDLVVAMAGQDISGIDVFYRVRFEMSAGVASEIKVLRNGVEMTMAITPVAVAEK